MTVVLWRSWRLLRGLSSWIADGSCGACSASCRRACRRIVGWLSLLPLSSIMASWAAGGTEPSGAFLDCLPLMRIWCSRGLPLRRLTRCVSLCTVTVAWSSGGWACRISWSCSCRFCSFPDRSSLRTSVGSSLFSCRGWWCGAWFFRGWWRWCIYASSIHPASSFSHDVLGCSRWSTFVRYYRDCCPLRRHLPACSYSPAGRSLYTTSDCLTICCVLLEGVSILCSAMFQCWGRSLGISSDRHVVTSLCTCKHVHKFTDLYCPHVYIYYYVHTYTRTYNYMYIY